MGLFSRIDHATADFAHERVPDARTIPSWHLFGIWFGVIINLALMNFGITLSRMMPLGEALLAFIIGQAILAALFALSGTIGVRTRLPFGRLIPITLGRHGAAIVMFAIALTCMAWFGFQLELFADALQSIAGDGFRGVRWHSLLIWGGGLLMITTSIVGFRALDRLQQVAMPLLFVALAWPLVLRCWTHGGLALQAVTIPDSQRLSFGAALSNVLGGSALGLLIVSDVTRFGRTMAGTIVATWTSFVFGGGFIFLVSILLGRMYDGADLAAVLPSLGIGVIGTLLVVLATWATNDPNVYVAALAIVSVAPSAQKWIVAIGLGLFGIVIASVGIVKHFLPFLSLIGMVFAPAGAVFMLDGILQTDRYESAHRERVSSLRVYPLLAWLFGVVLTFLTTEPSGLGLGLLNVTGVPAFDGLLTSGAAYLLLTRFESLARSRRVFDKTSVAERASERLS
jgi:cytosine permease